MLLHEHHILPTHAGGANDRTNILRCNPAMHAFLHKVRWMELGEWQDELAWKALTGQIGRDELQHRLSVEAGKMSRGRRLRPHARPGMSQAIRNHHAAHPVTADTRAKIGAASRGRKNNLGKKWTDEHKEKIRQAMLRRNEAKRKVETYGLGS